MATLAMAAYCTAENGRFPLTLRTLDSLARTVDWSRHRLVVIDNGSTCPQAQEFFAWSMWVSDSDKPFHYWPPFTRDVRVPAHTIIRNAENRGQARALNQGWLLAEKGSVVARCDDDVEFLDRGWLDRLCDCLDRDPALGIVALKRPDLWERPDHPDEAWRSELRMLPHEPGQDWLVVEQAKSVIGTVQAWSPRLVEKIGYLYQGSFKWGAEDPDAHCRATLAGFWCGFLHGPRIRHLDETPPGGSEYQRWKEKQGWEQMESLNRRRDAYRDGSIPLYRGPEEE